MAVQLHYYGSTFDLDRRKPDAFWIDYLYQCRGEIEAGTSESESIFLTLDGDRETYIPYRAGDRLVIVAPSGTFDADHRRALRNRERGER